MDDTIMRSNYRQLRRSFRFRGFGAEDRPFMRAAGLRRETGIKYTGFANRAGQNEWEANHGRTAGL